MPYKQFANSMAAPGSEKQFLIRELDQLRAELDDLRTKYAATLAKLDADAGVTDANYGSLGALAAKQFTPT
jgi:hypothetical protein